VRENQSKKVTTALTSNFPHGTDA